MENDLNKNRRRPQKKWRTTSKKMEDDLKKIFKNGRRSQNKIKKEDDLKHNYKNQP